MNEIISLSAVELAQKLRGAELSATEVLAAFRAQTEKRNGEVNAFVTFDWDRAELRAAELDVLAVTGTYAGPLHGVPIAIKDCFETKGLRTTWGSKSFEDFVPDYDVLHVERLREAGAVIVGKTNTPEFTFSGQTTNAVVGVTRNPHDLRKTVAGSSGGAAAALAAKMVPLADGSDLGGSTRTPAAWCGIVGFRPTSGLVPYHPNPASFDGLSVPGPMARSVQDLTLMLSVMQGNTTLQPLGYWNELPSLETLETPLDPGRIAMSFAPFGANVEASIISALSPITQLCRELGWDVDEDTAPKLDPLMAFGDVIRGQCALQVRAALNPDMELANDSFKSACASGEAQTLNDLALYQAQRSRVWNDVMDFFSTYDFALWPTTTGLAFDADLKDHELPEDWRTVTLTPTLELPSITIPFGTSSDGLPVGLHITGPKGSDAKLLRFARMIERANSGT
ncbi:amidase [Cochlodiniinecator piscidefendens]|uniref:amidase n=1 Tax=Cochlodiniinecator piscidefendens TaxID=2715756 RepID=UPI00140CCCE8|nr:amidase [Cochlodiniinecator piscidefendens]